MTNARKLSLWSLVSLLSLLHVGLAQDLDYAATLEAQNRLDEARIIYMDFLRGRMDNQVYAHYKGIELRLNAYSRLAAFSDTLVGKNPTNSELKLGRAEGLIRAGEMKAGVAVLDNLLRQEVELTPLAGAVLEQTGQDRDAIRIYTDYRRKRTSPGMFATNLLTLYEKTGDFSAATREAVLLLNVNPQLAAEYDQKFRAYVQKGAGEKVLAELARVNDAGLRSELRAKVGLALGRIREALELAAAQNNPKLLENLARYAESAGYLEPAAELFARAKLEYDRARVLRKLGRVAEAMAALSAGTGFQARFEYAELLRLERHEYASAETVYRSVLHMTRGHEGAYHGLADCLIRQGKFGDIAPLYAELPKKTEQGLYDLARIAFYEEEFDSCQDYVQQMLVLNPNGAHVNDGLELVLLITRGKEGLTAFARAARDFTLGRYDTVIVQCRTLLGGDPVWAAQAYLLTAECLREKREPNQALGALDELEQNIPASEFRPKARYIKGLILQEDLKNPTESEKVLSSIFLDFPDSPYAALARNRVMPTSKPKE